MNVSSSRLGKWKKLLNYDKHTENYDPRLNEGMNEQITCGMDRVEVTCDVMNEFCEVECIDRRLQKLNHTDDDLGLRGRFWKESIFDFGSDGFEESIISSSSIGRESIDILTEQSDTLDHRTTDERRERVWETIQRWRSEIKKKQHRDICDYLAQRYFIENEIHKVSYGSGREVK